MKTIILLLSFKVYRLLDFNNSLNFKFYTSELRYLKSPLPLLLPLLNSSFKKGEVFRFKQYASHVHMAYPYNAMSTL